MPPEFSATLPPTVHAIWLDGSGCVIEAVFLDRAADGEIGHAGLCDHAAILEIDLDDAVHAAEPDQDRVGPRQCATRKRRARTSRNDGHAFRAGKPQQRGNLVFGPGQDTGERGLAIGRQRVAVESRETGGLGHHPVGQDAAETGQDPGAARENFGIWWGKQQNARSGVRRSGH
jgi:hypothetical protein